MNEDEDYAEDDSDFDHSECDHEHEPIQRMSARELMYGLLRSGVDLDLPIYGYSYNGKEVIAFDLTGMAVQTTDDDEPRSFLLNLGFPEAFDGDTKEKIDGGIIMIDSWFPLYEGADDDE